MLDPVPSRRTRLAETLGRLSPAALALVGVVVVLAVGTGGYYVYRTYEYVEHDNEFCLSCHLMAEPFERFAQSAHQGLGCKACHRPNLLERSQMGLTAIVDDPEELSVHAIVPNETCAECHIEGNPEEWRIIANSAGHRAHLDSEQLEGLQCVECHATSIHEFAPVDRTCSQAGCHEDSTIRLGAMSDLTIHCAACHAFVEPVREESIVGDEVRSALLPDYDECFSCHVMRSLVAMPEPDPHGGACAACHDPHTQTEPEEAAQSCATAGCHDEPETLTSFHRGIDAEVADRCITCHTAHDFSIDGSDCRSCHAEGELAVPAGTQLGFDHRTHAAISCGGCHAEGDVHGEATVTGIEDCRSCHHREPVSVSCARCHGPADQPRETYEVTRSVRFSVGTADAERTLSFPHEAHLDEDCASCHTRGLALEVPEDLDCQSCHEEHHTPETRCASCHVAAPVSAHPPSEAHVTCSGAGCHQRVPFESVPRTRAFCLGCHQDLVDHEPGRRCEDCHQLPAPRGGGAPWP